MYISNSQPTTTQVLPTMYDLPSEDPDEFLKPLMLFPSSPSKKAPSKKAPSP